MRLDFKIWPALLLATFCVGACSTPPHQAYERPPLDLPAAPDKPVVIDLQW